MHSLFFTVLLPLCGNSNELHNRSKKGFDDLENLPWQIGTKTIENVTAFPLTLQNPNPFQVHQILRGPFERNSQLLFYFSDGEDPSRVEVPDNLETVLVS